MSVYKETIIREPQSVLS